MHIEIAAMRERLAAFASSLDFGLEQAHNIRNQVMSTIIIDIRASFERSMRLSSRRAFTSSPGIWLSEDEAKSPAMPGKMTRSRQNPAVRARAI